MLFRSPELGGGFRKSLRFIKDMYDNGTNIGDLIDKSRSGIVPFDSTPSNYGFKNVFYKNGVIIYAK